MNASTVPDGLDPVTVTVHVVEVPTTAAGHDTYVAVDAMLTVTANVPDPVPFKLYVSPS